MDTLALIADNNLSKREKHILATRLVIQIMEREDFDLALRTIEALKDIEDVWFLELALRLCYRFYSRDIPQRNFILEEVKRKSNFLPLSHWIQCSAGRKNRKFDQSSDLYTSLSFCRATEIIDECVAPMRRAIELVFELDRNPDELEILKLKLMSTTHYFMAGIISILDDDFRIYGPEGSLNDRSYEEDIERLENLGPELRALVGYGW